MPNASYYFTLFKKFQVLDNVPAKTYHGGGPPTGGFDLNDPNSVFGNSALGALLGANKVSSPLWAILNARANGTPPYGQVNVGGKNWPAMPPDSQAWTDFQTSSSTNPKLVDVFGNWITNAKNKDVPSGVIGTKPALIGAGNLDSGVKLFVCSMSGDTGKRPGVPPVPANFWETSLIFLVDPSNGSTINPATLSGGSEYYLAAVMGNRGDTDTGRYMKTSPPALPAVEAAASVMVWNTVDSPGVQLPSLSNLNVADKNGIYEQYFLRKGEYDVVGFRMVVQDVFDGIIAALTDAVSHGLNLGGLTPEQWVKQQPAHLCAKVVIRQQNASFPNFGESPILNERVAQKNLAPFNMAIGRVATNPNIIWKNFVVGQPLFLRLPGAGRNRITLETKVRGAGLQYYIAIPTETFFRFFGEGRGVFKGFEQLSREELYTGKLGSLPKPFPDAVILRYMGKDNVLELPPMGEEQYLAMSLGIEYEVKQLKHGNLGEVRMVHRAILPKPTPKDLCFELEETVAGGFTLLLRAIDPERGPEAETMGA